MIKKVFLIICIVLLFLGLNSVCGTEHSDWEKVTIGGVNFKIPLKYQNGHYVADTYMSGSVFDFSIASLKKRDLQDIYGYESTIDELVSIKEKHIRGHDLVILHSYRGICRHNVTYIFFGINKKIFAISYNGGKLTKNIKKIIMNTPASKISKSKFYKKLNIAQKNYLEVQRYYDEAYAYSEGYRKGVSSNNYKKHDFLNYYLGYRLFTYLSK